MLIYFVTYALLLASPILIGKLSQKKYRNRNIAIFCFILVWGLLALRHPSMGKDLRYEQEKVGYIQSFFNIIEKSWTEVFLLDNYYNYEKGYLILNKLIGSIFPNIQFFLAVVAFLSLAPIFYVIYKKSVSPVFSILVYMGLSPFLLTYSGLRQSIAIAMCFLSIIYIERKRILPFICIILLATTIHTSALVFLLAYPLYQIRFSQKTRLVTIFGIGLVYLIRVPLFSALIKIMGRATVIDNNNSITLFLVFCMIYVFCIFYTGPEYQGNLNLFFIACCIQGMGGVNLLVIRVGYYFILPLCVLLPNIIDKISNKKERILIKLGVGISFLTWGLFSIYNTDWAMAYPYIPFWGN